MEYNSELSRPWKKPPFGGISANVLRIIAMVGMLLDHAWATIVPGSMWMTCVGRIVFPIYAFQLTEGFFHTANRKKYVKRLLFFAVISEIPFNFVMSSSWIYPFQQNTIFTLLLGLWAISNLDAMRKGEKKPVKALLLVACAFLVAIVGFVDYGWKGVLTVVVLYAFRGASWAWLGQLACMIVIHGMMFKGQVIPELSNLPVQAFAILALIPIWLYNGKRGRGGKVMQYAAYWYYPIHLAVLAALQAML